MNFLGRTASVSDSRSQPVARTRMRSLLTLLSTASLGFLLCGSVRAQDADCSKSQSFSSGVLEPVPVGPVQGQGATTKRPLHVPVKLVKRDPAGSATVKWNFANGTEVSLAKVDAASKECPVSQRKDSIIETFIVAVPTGADLVDGPSTGTVTATIGGIGGTSAKIAGCDELLGVTALILVCCKRTVAHPRSQESSSMTRSPSTAPLSPQPGVHCWIPVNNSREPSS